ncbi:hypothetical protein A3L09_04335 [Thermococcus profundus]|uniref:Uncharacterized protein n=1 Tax=Thermococcus profundus TaxID=49899 RepID=A0A2Z2M9V2_THEPR|nr:hypothetical protein [Thermococcus profundus]ASJ02536.1 hypothetical protein A3L09_04335 [Thermococcus profundus]
MNGYLIFLTLLFVALATYANMKGVYQWGTLLSGFAGGFALWLLFEGRLNPLVSFSTGFLLTVAFEWGLSPRKR